MADIMDTSTTTPVSMEALMKWSDTQVEKNRQLVHDQLDKQLSTHIQPLKNQLSEIQNSLTFAHNEITELKGKIEKVDVIEKTVENQGNDIQALRRENQQLKEDLVNHEYQNRRDNLQFMGYQENKGENAEALILETLSKAAINVGNRTIVRAHRLGKYEAYRTRPILVKFSHWKDRDLVWHMKDEINQQSHIRIFEDWPKEILAKRKVLLPIFHAARLEKDDHGIAKNKVTMARDKAIINGTVITVDKIDRLPKHLQPEQIFTPTKGNMVAFFTVNSPLSNHYPSPFTLDGNQYNCNEQYIMYQKAILFGDTNTATKIMQQSNPGVQKGIGKNVVGFNKHRWEAAADKIFLRGLRAKFAQNPNCAEMLRATGNKNLYEGSPKDTVYGVGLSIFDQDIWNQANHKGRNLMGLWLEVVRAELPRR